MSDFTTRLSACTAGCFFLGLSVILIPYTGIQEDEALYSMPLYLPLGRELQIQIFHHSVPLMLMSYLGTLKTALYALLISLTGSGVWATRLPMALAGAVTIYLFFYLCLGTRSTGALAAMLGALLLATDASFLLTNTFDWGPVALEHVLLVGGCLLLCHFATDSSQMWRLALGAFLFGLALWNKALFLWALSGVTAGTVTVFWQDVKRLSTRRHLLVAAVAFLLGAFPFILFNLRNQNATLGDNFSLDATHLARKWAQVRLAANGSALFGFLVANDAANEVPEIATPVNTAHGRAAVWIHARLGDHHDSGLYYIYGALLLAVPLWWRSRAARFSLVFLAVSWMMMALTKDAGQALHHVILLWPFPVLFAAATLAAIPWRWVAICLGASLVLLNLLVVNQYVFQFERYGASGNFTDALFPLAQALPEDRPIDVMDFGMFVNMELAHQGRLHARFAGDPMRTDSPNPAEQAQLRAMLAEPGALFVDHVPSLEEFRGVGANLDRFAAAAGYHKEPVRTVTDSHGRPVFEIFQFRRM